MFIFSNFIFPYDCIFIKSHIFCFTEIQEAKISFIKKAPDSW